MSPADVQSHIPQVLPHYRRRDRQLFFMISTHPTLELSPDEVRLVESMDGRRTVAELEKTCPGAGDRLLSWQKAGVVALIPPITAPPSPHLVVIEPHMDDAALSAGGRLLHRRGRCRITILSAVRWSNFTSYLFIKRSFLDVRTITELRLQESIIAARLLGAEHRCLDWTDAPLRFWPAERWTLETVERFAETPQAFANLPPTSKEVALLAEQLMHHVSVLSPDELWIPMGLGWHVDHRMTRSACLMMLAEAGARFSGIPVVMYEDLPLARADQAAQIRVAFAACGTRLVRGSEDIADVFEEKLRVLSVYASQFKLSVMGPRIRACAEHEGGTGAGALAEACHRVEGGFHLPHETNLSQDAARLAVLRTEMRALLGKRERHRRLVVMLTPAGHLGRWTADRERLLAAFPNADLRVYVAEEGAWQAGEGGSGRLRVSLVPGGRWGWVGVFARELFRFRTPTVILWWGFYGSGSWLKRKLIEWLLPFRVVLSAWTLSDFCCLLIELGVGEGSNPARR